MTVASTMIRAGAHLARRGMPCCLVLLAVLLTLLPGPPPAHGAVTVPPSFDDRLVTDFYRPSAMAFTPDGRLLIASTLGTMNVYENGALRPTPALDISSKVCFDNERGLLGRGGRPRVRDEPLRLRSTTRSRSTASARPTRERAGQPRLALRRSATTT